MANGQYDQAIADYTKSIEIDPKHPNIHYAYNNRGLAYMHKGQDDQAIADYNFAIELNPKYAEAYLNRGLAYESIKNIRMACYDWKRACELGDCRGYWRANNNELCVWEGLE